MPEKLNGTTFCCFDQNTKRLARRSEKRVAFSSPYGLVSFIGKERIQTRPKAKSYLVS